MEIDFNKIEGPLGSKTANFEELVSQLLTAELNAESMDGSGGDEGIDCFLKKENSDRLTIFQVKYFTGRLNGVRRKQIKKSYDAACRKSNIERWILCVPINPTPAERRWFESLSNGEAKIEWWGQTKLRVLIAKHPEISKVFFKDDTLLLNEFRGFRSEIGELIQALQKSRWKNQYGYGKSSIPSLYLRRAVDLSKLLKNDMDLIGEWANTHIFLDFSEIHAFISSDSSMALSIPVVEYCFRESPQVLTLPPGAVYEMRRSIDWLLSRKEISNWDERLKEEKIHQTLVKFMNAFEEYPEAPLTYTLYRSALDQILRIGTLTWHGFRKLSGVIKSGVIKAVEEREFDLVLKTEFFRNALYEFNHYRPNNSPANMADAINMSFLMNTILNRTGFGRMISSAMSFVMVAEKLFHGIQPVRTSQQYAYLIHLNSLYSKDVDRMHILLEILSSTAADLMRLFQCEMNDIDRLIFKNPKELFIALREFAPIYRDILRPVDRMIESGIASIPKMHITCMREFYSTLKAEADMVSGFRRWWEQMCDLFRSMDEYLVENHSGEKITKTISDIADQKQ